MTLFRWHNGKSGTVHQYNPATQFTYCGKEKHENFPDHYDIGDKPPPGMRLCSMCKLAGADGGGTLKTIGELRDDLRAAGIEVPAGRSTHPKAHKRFKPRQKKAARAWAKAYLRHKYGARIEATPSNDKLHRLLHENEPDRVAAPGTVKASVAICQAWEREPTKIVRTKVAPSTKRPPKRHPSYDRPLHPFYDSPRWRALRVDILARGGNRCVLCGATALQARLHVDHIKPRSLHPELEWEPSNLQVLCEPCNLGKSNRYEDDWRPTMEAAE